MLLRFRCKSLGYSFLFRFSYEAAVCGGIPVINALQTDFVADEITSVMGIMNGRMQCISLSRHYVSLLRSVHFDTQVLPTSCCQRWKMKALITA